MCVRGGGGGGSSEGSALKMCYKNVGPVCKETLVPQCMEHNRSTSMK